jgi:hypothetical protein
MWEAISIVVAFLLCCLFIVVWMYRVRKKDEEEASYVQRALEEGVRTGELTEDGLRACVVCGAAATSFFPISASSWMDRLPLLNRLFSLPPRYVIVDDLARGTCLCRAHKEYSVKKLEEFHAMLRAERAQFNAAQADKVSQMDTGGLQQCLNEHHIGTKRMLGMLEAASMPRLQEKVASPVPEQTSVTIVMAPESSE